METRRLGRILTLVFAFALVMGPGPGLYLVNPDPGDPEATRFLLGMPILWTWAVFWFLVMAVVVWAADRKLWRPRNGESAGEEQ